MSGREVRPPLAIGKRVVVGDAAAGRVVGWHSSRTWILGRVEVRAYVIVDLDGGGRRLVRTADLAQEPPAR